MIRRTLAGIIAIACAAVLITAAQLQPAQKGVGTHEQLGMNPCSLYERTGVPCGSCGMTTAFSHAAHAQFAQSFVTQPMGMVLSLITAMALWISGYTAIRNPPIEQYLKYLMTARFWLMLLALFLGAWMYKIVVTQLAA